MFSHVFHRWHRWGSDKCRLSKLGSFEKTEPLGNQRAERCDTSRRMVPKLFQAFAPLSARDYEIPSMQCVILGYMGEDINHSMNNWLLYSDAKTFYRIILNNTVL